MTRRRQLAAALGVAATAAAGLLVGCSSEPTAGPPAAGPASGVGQTVPVPVPTTATVRPTDAAAPPESPEPATAPPPAIAGPVGPRNLPQPAALGRGWRTYDHPGGAEQGFQGNSTWTRRRDPHQAAFEALPIGCANPLPDSALPIPDFALQGSYRNPAGGPATVLVLRFATAAKASSYFTGYGARMKACGAPRDASFDGLAVVPLWSAEDAAAAVRRYTGSETFVEVSVRRDASVALLASAAGAGQSERSWTRSAAVALAAPLR